MKIENKIITVALYNQATTEVEATVYDSLWAVHKTTDQQNSRSYSLTHIPSGCCRVFTHNTKAHKAARLLAKEFPGWGRKFPFGDRCFALIEEDKLSSRVQDLILSIKKEDTDTKSDYIEDHMSGCATPGCIRCNRESNGSRPVLA